MRLTLEIIVLAKSLTWGLTRNVPNACAASTRNSYRRPQWPAGVGGHLPTYTKWTARERCEAWGRGCEKHGQWLVAAVACRLQPQPRLSAQEIVMGPAVAVGSTSRGWQGSLTGPGGTGVKNRDGPGDCDGAGCCCAWAERLAAGRGAVGPAPLAF